MKFLLKLAGALALTAPLDAQPVAPPCTAYRLAGDTNLNREQKACYYFQNKLATGSGVFGALFWGSVAQLRKEPHEWPQGADGLGRRIGTRYAQGMTKSTAEFIVGALNYEDPRTTIRGEDPHHHRKTTFQGRLGEALLRTVWIHRDNGHRDFIAFSHFAGAFSSGFVGRIWTPDSQNGLAAALERSGTAMGGYAANSIFQEFQPDVVALFAKMFGGRKGR